MISNEVLEERLQNIEKIMSWNHQEIIKDLETLKRDIQCNTEFRLKSLGAYVVISFATALITSGIVIIVNPFN